jgi:hypothetical protein
MTSAMTPSTPSRAHHGSGPAGPREALSRHAAADGAFGGPADRLLAPGPCRRRIADPLRLQDHCRQIVRFADLQALTDGKLDPRSVASSVYAVAVNYLAAGIDPARTVIYVQPQVPELADLTMLLLDLAPFGRVARNPCAVS